MLKISDNIESNSLLKANILVKTSNRTLYIHEYNGVLGFQFHYLVALEPINQQKLMCMVLMCNM